MVFVIEVALNGGLIREFPPKYPEFGFRKYNIISKYININIYIYIYLKILKNQYFMDIWLNNHFPYKYF